MIDRTIHLDSYALGTWRHTAYFRAHAPGDYPIMDVCAAAGAHAHLPPHLRELAARSQTWGRHHGWVPVGIDDFFDADGNELDPETRRRLPLPPAPHEVLRDVPVPAGGWPDPLTWEPAPESVDGDEDVDERPSEDQVLDWIRSHGAARVAKEYGVSGGAKMAPADLARAISAK